jgi:hypothetical protein
MRRQRRNMFAPDRSRNQNVTAANNGDPASRVPCRELHVAAVPGLDCQSAAGTNQFIDE